MQRPYIHAVVTNRFAFCCVHFVVCILLCAFCCVHFVVCILLAIIDCDVDVWCSVECLSKILLV